MSDKIAENVEELISGIEKYWEHKVAHLTYDGLCFRLKTAQDPDVEDFAYSMALFYSALHGGLNVEREEVERAIEMSGLSPGDTTITAYSLKDSKAFCESVAKVLAFQTDGVTPKKLLHIWPTGRPNKAMTPAMLWGREIEDERTGT